MVETKKEMKKKKEMFLLPSFFKAFQTTSRLESGIKLRDFKLASSGTPLNFKLASSGTPPSSSSSAAAAVKPTFLSMLTSKPEAGKEKLAPIVKTPPVPRWTAEEISELFYVFVLEDGVGACHSKGKTPRYNVTNNVTPHGLWPQNRYGSPLNDKQKPFSENLIPLNMSTWWPNVLLEDRGRDYNYDPGHIQFWRKQWAKHGIKGLLDQRTYFNLVKTLQDFFAPKVNREIRNNTINRDGRKYLNVPAFVRSMLMNEEIFVTVHPYRDAFTFRGELIEVEFLGEIRMYLEGRDPYTTLDPTTLGLGSTADLWREMQIIKTP